MKIKDYHRLTKFRIAPSLAEIRWKLCENEKAIGLPAGSVSWLNEGIELEAMR